jgi:hypothetical protein
MEDNLPPLAVSGVKLLVLKKPQVLESDPNWLLVVCQLCSDSRLMLLRWPRQERKSFPALFNTLKLRETLVVSGEYTQRVFFHRGTVVCNRSIIASNVEIYSPDGPINDGCAIRLTSDEDARADRDMMTLIQLLGTKMKLDALTSEVQQMQIRTGSATSRSATVQSPIRKEESPSGKEESPSGKVEGSSGATKNPFHTGRPVSDRLKDLKKLSETGRLVLKKIP